MTRRLSLLIGALSVAAAFDATSAHAGGRFGGGHFAGGAHVSGHVGGYVGGGFHGSVHVGGGYGYRPTSVNYQWSRPAWRPYHWGVSGHIWVGGGGYYGCGWGYNCGYPYYYYPSYVPSYYSGSYYPVEASVGPSAVAVVAPRPELPRLGIGLFAGGTSTDAAQTAGMDVKESDVGLLGRFRLSGGLLVEGEIGRTSYSVNGQDNLRVDRRLGGSLIYEIGAYNKLAPYILAGLGVQQANVNGNYNTTQDFGELGVGLRYALSPGFHITFDIRRGTRSTVASDSTPPSTIQGAARTVTPPPQGSGADEGYTRGRLAAILYF